jgi:hypothetical protein
VIVLPSGKGEGNAAIRAFVISWQLLKASWRCYKNTVTFYISICSISKWIF